ncbi:MAG: class I SAM-dependent methyltransferase [Gammaproteobacteria bacterium]|nr:class I SAM-dependent methyltransferase [Gammaproteobacteria bacterium]
MTDPRGNPDHLPEIRAQYEALPYPPRDPADERHRLIQRTADHLLLLNHRCYRGARDFRDGFRVLVAGGGTGDSTIYLAEQLRGFGAEIVHLDFSAASLAIAQERARMRGLDGISWVRDSLMNLPRLGLGSFDYINCTGVLHHLESTEAGLRLLAGALRPGGAMLLMLYGRYGRRSVYDMQELLRGYLPPDANLQDKLRLTRALLAALPPTHSFHRDLDFWRYEISPDGLGDAGLQDLLLHGQDRCFSVPDIHALMDSAGLEVIAFTDRASDYDPRTHVRDPGTVAHLDGLGQRPRQAIAELMTSDINSHEFYAGRPGETRVASIGDENNALILMGQAQGRHREIGAALAPGRSVTFSGRSGTATVAGNPANRVLFSLMDGVTPLSEVYRRVLAEVPDITSIDLRRGVHDLYRVLEAQGHLCLLEAGSYGSKVPDYSRLPPAQ